jgi:hypothetical protein
MKNFCEWCHGNTFDDERGNCIACGGNRFIHQKEIFSYGTWIKEIEKSHSKYFGSLMDEFCVTDEHGTIHLNYRPINNNIVIVFEKLHKDKHGQEYIFYAGKNKIQTWYRNEKVRVKYLTNEV